MSPADLHADSTRQAQFRALIRSPRTVILCAIPVIAAAVGVGIYSIPLYGIVAGLGFLVLGLAVVWLIADSRAEEDFLDAYAEANSLETGGGKGELPPATPLLRLGDGRWSDRVFAGRLPGGLEGALAVYSYQTRSTDSEGRTHTELHPYTVVLAELPEASAFIGQLSCERREGARVLDSAEDTVQKRHRVEVESVEVDKRYELFIGAEDDPGRARQLLSPSFLDWLATGNEWLGFELEDGMLVCNIPWHLESADELDHICEDSSHIAERISSEAAESAPAADAPSPDAEPDADADAGPFDPHALVVPSTGKGVTQRLENRLWSVAILAALAIGVGYGFLTMNDDGTDPAPRSFSSSEGADEGRPFASYDEKLLAEVKRNQLGPKGATDRVLYAASRRNIVDAWVTDAFARDLIEAKSLTGYRLTPKGEKTLERERR